MARPRKTTAKLKQEGRYREDRHGGRADSVIRSGVPNKPARLTGDAGEVWDTVVSTLPPESLAKTDFALLGMLCDWYAVYLDAMASCDVAAAEKAGKRVESIGMRFGLDPVSRAKINVPQQTSKDETSPFKILDALTRESA